MLGEVTGWTLADGLAVRTTLDPVAQGFLEDHRIDGTPVLPGVMGIEAFAEVASASASGWTVLAIEEVTFLAPCKFFRDEPRDLELVARPRLVGADLVADCRLLARRTLVNQPEQLTTHFTGRVRLHPGPLARSLRQGDRPGEPSDRGSAPRPSTASTSTAPPTRSSTPRGVTANRSSASWRSTCLRTTSRTMLPFSSIPG